MRKFEQRKILESLQMLEEAHSELRKKLALETLTNLLSDCQALAIQIGEYTEEIAGEGTKTVALLEEYCELAYHASLGSDGTNYIKKLKKHLITITDTVREELRPDKLEAVFFPYNASMWDSLESVFLAAKNDPQCDAYVVPIPYYEVNSDGTLGKMHCDADKYPDNIPVTDWRKYDIESRHPDIAFIQYPYDDNANNASIHPDFYSEYLRKHCERLIYLPYFIAMGKDVDEYNGYLPGVLNADRVILESEKIRQAYIRHYKKYDKDLGLYGKYGKAEEKFVALGSPKMDKIINTKREDCELPDAWRRLIFKPDGSRKKIVLYNTHMFTWIKHGDEYFEKVRSVFELFKNRDDIVLWWRPHPNTELNFRVKRPQWLNEYRALVDDCKNGGWAIFDGTPDLHRAIAWSDAYYGDGSSLVAMYQAFGKPVMLQYIAVFEAAADTTHINDFCELEDDLWFVEDKTNALIRMNKSTWEKEIAGFFPSAGKSGFDLYIAPIPHGDAIYFTPFRAGTIAEYSLSTKEFTLYPYNTSLCENNGSHFRDAIRYQEFLFFTPYRFPAILRFNTVTKEIAYFSDWVEPMKEYIGDVDDAFFCGAISVKNSIWQAACGANAVLEYNMETGRHTVYEVGKKGNRYRHLCFDGECFWLSPRHNTSVVKWNPQTGETGEFDVFEEDEKDITLPFCRVIYHVGAVWLLPWNAKHALKIDVRTHAVTIAEAFEPRREEKDHPASDHNYLNAQVLGSRIIATSRYGQTLVELDCESGSRREGPLRYGAKSCALLRGISARPYIRNPEQLQTARDCLTRENRSKSLEIFLNYAVSYGDSEEETALRSRRRELAMAGNANTDGTAGQAIYHYTKRILE